jgi:hypothetical protein
MTRLDDLLDSSAPPLSEPPDVGNAVAELVLATRRIARPSPRRRRRRLIAAGAAAAVIVAGGAAAATTAVHGWTPWVDKPFLASYTFTLPGGGSCQVRLGDLQIDDAQEQERVQEWLGSRPVSELVDVDAALQQIRSGPDTVRRHGRTIRVGYGTRHYNADKEYADAESRALGTAVLDKLAADGFPDLSVRWTGGQHCTEPDGTTPPWMR